MGLLKNGKRRIIYKDRIFYWFVRSDGEEIDIPYINIISDDKKFIVSYRIGQSKLSSESHIIVQRKEFNGLSNPDNRFIRVNTPSWEDEVVTSELIIKIIEWYYSNMENLAVLNWTNEEVEKRYKYFKEQISLIKDEKQKVDLFLNKMFGIVIGGYKESEDLEVYITEHFLKNIEKSKIAHKNTFWNALSNIKYGYNPIKSNSPGGKDGIYIVTEDYKPKNDMILKLYDKYLRTEKGRNEINKYIDTKKVVGVRIVAHGLRILAFIGEYFDLKSNKKNKLVLIDADINND